MAELPLANNYNGDSNVNDDVKGNVNANLNTRLLRQTLLAAMRNKFNADNHGLLKKHVKLRVYVTDVRGIVLFDSKRGEWEGQDFSRWNDVYLTLRGKYGARSTRLDPNDPDTSSFYVAAPILRSGKIIGSLTVVKSKMDIKPFIDAARNRIALAVVISMVAGMIFALLSTLWITKPLAELEKRIRQAGRAGKDSSPMKGSPDIRRLASVFETMREKLEGKKYVAQYLQTMTHEIKSPLSSIRACAELLSEKLPIKKRDEFLAGILRGAERIGEITDRLLRLSSLEGRRKLQSPSKTNAAVVAQEAVDQVRIQSENRNTKIELIIRAPSASDSMQFFGEKHLIVESLVNLLQNALSFSPGEGRIELEVFQDGDFIHFHVRDEGPGLPDYALPLVFERFYSLERPGGKARSSGLGLTFVQEAAQLHGGVARIRNRPGGGAEASLELPATKDMQGAKAASIAKATSKKL